jgi:hypothetical protein
MTEHDRDMCVCGHIRWYHFNGRGRCTQVSDIRLLASSSPVINCGCSRFKLKRAFEE